LVGFKQSVNAYGMVFALIPFVDATFAVGFVATQWVGLKTIMEA
jgi:hypothetical protein